MRDRERADDQTPSRRHPGLGLAGEPVRQQVLGDQPLQNWALEKSMAVSALAVENRDTEMTR